MQKFALLAVLAAVPLWAKDKPPLSDYQDAVLVSFRTVTTGSSCSHSADTSGHVNATTDDDGNTTGMVNSTTSGYSNCSDTGWVYYTLQVGDHIYVVHHAPPFFRQSDLAHNLPGTHVLVRTDAKHFYVRIDKKESKFVIVEAR